MAEMVLSKLIYKLDLLTNSKHLQIPLTFTVINTKIYFVNI